MTSRRFATVFGILVVVVLLSGCVALDDPSNGENTSDVDPEAVFEGAFVHADDLEDVRGNRTTEVTNGSVTVAERVRVQKRPYVDERTEVSRPRNPPERERSTCRTRRGTGFTTPTHR